MYFYCKAQGFSLFELITVIVLVVIISLISLPFYHEWMQKQEFRSIHPMIQQHISYARSQALIKRTTVVICPTESFLQCEKDKWHKGLIIFVDKNKNKQLDDDEHILLKTEKNIKYGSLTWIGSSSSRDVLTFQGDTGLPRGSPGSFYYCSHHDTGHNTRYKIGRMATLNSQPTSKC
jgi:type IV fimbrial biogenesis protein FimT